MEHIGKKVKIVRDNRGRNIGVGLSGIIVNCYHNYYNYGYIYEISTSDGSFNCDPYEFELYTEPVKEEVVYINQIAEDLAKIK